MVSDAESRWGVDVDGGGLMDGERTDESTASTNLYRYGDRRWAWIGEGHSASIK